MEVFSKSTNPTNVPARDISTKKDSKELRASLVTISVVTAFIELVCPITTMFIIADCRNIAVYGDNDSIFLIAREIAQIMEHINYSITIFL